MRICVILNPKAHSGRAARYHTVLGEMCANSTFKITRARGDARALAAEAVRQEFDIIVAGGGDGTLNEVVNGIGDELNGFARVRLAVLPLGTANCFARELGVPLDCERAWQVVLGGKEVLVDLPVAEFYSNGRRERRVFVQVAGAGVDARAIQLANSARVRTGYLAYVLSGFKAIDEFKPAISVLNGDRTMTGEQVMVTNGRHYGGPFVLAPMANVRDGQLDVSVLPHATWGVVARVAWGIATRRLHRAAGMRQFRAEKVSLQSPTHALLELDGELVGELPATIIVRPRTLRVAVSDL